MRAGAFSIDRRRPNNPCPIDEGREAVADLTAVLDIATRIDSLAELMLMLGSLMA